MHEPTAYMLAIAGVTFRQFRGEPDYPMLAALQNVVNQAYGIEAVLSPEEIAIGFAHPSPGEDFGRDILMAEAEGRLVGYAHVEPALSLRADGTRVFEQDLVIHPEWQARLGTTLLEFTERRANEIAIEAPMDAPHYLSMWQPEANTAAVTMLLARGYTAARHFFTMRRDLTTPWPTFDAPAGVRIAAFEPSEAAYRAVYVANREAFRDHWGYREWTEEDYARWRDQPTHDPTLWRIAYDVATGEIAGVALNEIYHADNARYGFRRGWIENLSVRRPWRGRGVAKALLASSFAVLRERGMTEVMLGVDVENPTGALRLYESTGFTVRRRSAVYQKPLPIGLHHRL